MAQVETVQGAVDASELGTVLIHEHVRFRDEAVAENWPGRYDEEAELAAALEAVNAAKDRGVDTIVDPTAMFGGRDVRFMRRVADQTGVRIVPCTGIYTYDYLPHYFENRSEDQMAELFVEDIEQGIQGTDMKAAFLKCAADAPGVTDNVEKVHRAVARASLQTGAPIMAHSRPASNTGPRQSRSSSRRASSRTRSRSPTPVTATTSTTSRGCSTPASGSASTATGSTSTSRTIDATRRRPSCSAAVMRGGSSSPRMSARRSTGSRPRRWRY